MTNVDDRSFDNERWQRLESRLLSVMAVDVPGWADRQASDPGMALVEMIAFLAEQLMLRQNAMPDGARARLAALAVNLELLSNEDDGAAVSVRIDGENWRQTDVLGNAAADDRVFAVIDDGRIAFGDGRHGRRPAPGSRVSASRCDRPGAAGNARVSVTTRWPPARSRYFVATDPESGIRISRVADLIELFGGETRPNYFDGRLLTAADLRDEQQYWLGKHRSHNRMLHGPGVVQGLGVSTDPASPDGIVVAPGLAIDARGCEVRLRQPATMTAGGTSPLLVIVSYAERCTEPVPAPDGSGGTAASRVEEGASVLLAENDNVVEGVAVARVLPTAAGWKVDDTFVPKKVARRGESTEPSGGEGEGTDVGRDPTTVNDEMPELARYRRYFAEEIGAVARLQTPGLVSALASVERERFLPPGPWTILAEADFLPGRAAQTRTTADADPRRVHHDVAVAIDPSRQLYNGQPSALAKWIDALDLPPGARVLHVGAGLGYYTAVIAATVGPRGAVTAFEIDEALARQARANLASLPTVTLRAGDASGPLSESFDAILVNAGVTHPLDSWLDALSPDGRMIVPITATMPAMGAAVGKGLVWRLTRRGTEFDAAVVAMAAIYSALGVRDESLNEAVGRAMMGGPMQWQAVRRLRRDAHAPTASCWLHLPTLCFSTA